MKKQNIWKQMSVWLRAFAILALAFLVVGFGTIGSVHSTGKAYELTVRGSGDAKEPGIIFELTDPEEANHGKTGHVHNRKLYVKEVYINVGTIYANPGEYATIRLGRGTTAASAFTSYVDLTLSNLYETVSEGDESVIKPTNDLFNWHAFNVPEAGWSLSTYDFYRITARTHNVLINEIVFVAYETDSTKPVLLNATVNENSVVSIDSSKETPEQALKRASAVVDRQRIPSLAQSSFFRFGAEEIYSMMTISEMRLGATYSEGSVYNADRVYNTFGISVLALGTAIFGMSPFGLRIMPMLAAFGALVFGFLFVRKLLKSDKAGFVFALMFVLSGITLSLAHFGTPLMIGVFFFMASLYYCYRFFAEGMKKANFASALPVLLSGLFGAAAICTNGAFVIPMVGVVGLFAAGLVRMRKASKYYLDKAIAEAEAETPEEGEVPAGKEKVATVLTEERSKFRIATVLFAAILVLGTFLIATLSVLPLYYTYTKVYDDPADPTMSVFYFLWQAFAGGFVGANLTGRSTSAWNFFYVLFRGTGDMYAVTATGLLVSLAALLLGIAGAVYAIVKLVRNMNGESYAVELRTVLILVTGFVLSIITAAFAQGGLAFLLIAYFFLFALAAYSVKRLETAGRAGAIVCRAGLVLLVLGFVLFAVFTFSIPLPAGFIAALVG